MDDFLTKKVELEDRIKNIQYAFDNNLYYGEPESADYMRDFLVDLKLQLEDHIKSNEKISHWEL